MKILNTLNTQAQISASDFGTPFENKFCEEWNKTAIRVEHLEKNSHGVDFSLGKSSVYGMSFDGLQIEFKVSTGPDFRIRFNKRQALLEQTYSADVFLIAIVPEEIRKICLHEEFSILSPRDNTKRKIQDNKRIEGEEEARLQFCIVPSKDIHDFYTKLDTQERFGTGIMPLDAYAKEEYLRNTRDTLSAIRKQKLEIFRERTVARWKTTLLQNLPYQG